MGHNQKISATIPKEDLDYIEKRMRHSKVGFSTALHLIIVDAMYLDEVTEKKIDLTKGRSY